MSEDFLADVPKEGADPFKELEKDAPTDSPSETKPEADKPAVGESTPDENLPFHKHPHWIKREEELKELRERDELYRKELDELKSFRSEAETRLNSPSEIPDWFRELYGDNKPAYEKYVQYENQRLEKVRNEAVAVLEAKQKEATEQAERWNKWVDVEINKLKNLGLVFDRNELLKMMLDNRESVVGEDGNYDFTKGYKLLMGSKGDVPSGSDARKRIADTTTNAKGTEPIGKKTMTAEELRKTSWSNL